LLYRAPTALLLVAALTTAACGGGNGDAHSTPLGTAYGDGSRIPDVVREPTWIDPEDEDSESCAYPDDQRVNVTGVTVVAIDRYDETGEGAQGNFYVQDSFAQTLDRYAPPEPGKPLSFGVTVFAPSFSPPDLRLAPGDVVDLLGGFMEFAGPSNGRFPECRTLPEMAGTMTFRFEGGEEVEPTPVTLDDLRGYESARRYLGMLVRLEDVKIAGNPAESGGRYTASINMGAGVPSNDVVKISNELYNLKGEGPQLSGMTFGAVTGVVTYFYGFKIAPRSPADFEL